MVQDGWMDAAIRYCTAGLHFLMRGIAFQYDDY